jgi:diguanylate cyclase (GGDEF)-like protein
MHNCLRPCAARLAVALALFACWASVLAAWPLADRLADARELIGIDPLRARTSITQLRNDAVAAAALDVRVEADEIECRLLTDLNLDEARRVADAGLAVAAAATPPPARLPLLRLRVCHASVLIDAGQEDAGLAELEAVLRQAAEPPLAAARGLALMERGIHRSRVGALSDGQSDLLAACALLAPQPRDVELCRAHLANHYRRIGDLDEALPLALRLLDDAHRRGALFDESIYVMITARIHTERGEHDRALVRYAEAERFATQVKDGPGVVKSEHGYAQSLLALKRPAEALGHVDRALQGLETNPEPAQRSSSLLLRAEILNALGRAREALDLLQTLEKPLRERPNPGLLAPLLRHMADAQARLGHWREAWLALSEWSRIDQAVQTERNSKDSARLRLQFNRERDDQELAHLRRLNEQGEHLRTLQAVALTLLVVLLALLGGLAAHRWRREREARVLASTDELTGLLNRRALLAHAEAAVLAARQQREPLVLLMIDADHFKQINDRHGHAFGDEVLRHLAQVLGTALRQRDRLGRLGGEEFAAVLPGAGAAQAGQIAERMREAVAATPARAPEGEAPCTVSIGVAELGPEETVAQALQRADAALYAAKQAGRNAVAQARPA